MTLMTASGEAVYANDEDSQNEGEATTYSAEVAPEPIYSECHEKYDAFQSWRRTYER